MISNIKEMDINELEEVMDIWLTENHSVQSFLSENYILEYHDRIKHLLKKSKVFIYKNNKEIQGFISLSGNYIDCFYVKSKYQGQGIGKALIKHCKGIFWSLMIKVYQQNQNAISFLEKQSFFVRDKMDNAETGQTELFLEWIR